GCTFLCVFGLPGDKQSNEGSQALECAYKIHKFCAVSLMKIKVVSIGVTSGPVFCGVVGHHVRHEYTVIGRKVNLAARMMMCYPGLVTCDEVIYLESKLPYYFFQELPVTEMKGIRNPGTIYKYLVTERTMIGKAYLTKQRYEEYPLLGRKRETDLFEATLENFKVFKKSHIMLYEGLFGYGKSQLMAELAYIGQTVGHKVVAMELGKINSSDSFFTIRTLMAIFLGIDTCKTYDARQRILLTKLRGLVEDAYFCLLNKLFHIKFPASEEVSEMDSDQRHAKMEAVLVTILEQAAEKEILIFVIDEGQFIDPASWDFLDNLLRAIPIFIVMSLSPSEYKGIILCSTATRILGNMANTYVKLKALSPSVIVQKACQDLGVVSITRELETFLIQRSHGNPFYCEELLRSLHSNNILQFYILEEEEDSEDEWDSLFATTTLKPQGSKLLDNEERTSYICTIRQNVKLHNIMLPPTLKGVALSKIDNMNPSEQMVVKCAAVIGVTFSTHLLLHILPQWTKMKMNQTLAALVETHTFECFTEGKTRLTVQTMDIFNYELGNFPKNMAIVEQDSVLGSVIAKSINQEEAVMNCKSMGFCTPLLREAAYELWLKSQKSKLHLKCASYLESDAHRCKCCGKGDFVAFHHYAVDVMMWKIGEIKNEPERDALSEAASAIVSRTLLCLDASRQEGPEKKDVAPRHRYMQDYEQKSSQETGPEHLAGLTKRLFRGEMPMMYQTPLTIQDSFRATEEERTFLYRLDEIIWFLEYGVRRIKTGGSCSCEETVESIIVPLSHHCMALGDNVRAFYYLLECAAAYSHLSNNYMVSYNMGQLNLGKKLVRKALQFLNRSFPLTIVGAFFMSMVESSKHRSHQKKQISWETPVGEKKLAILYQQCRCLSLLWQIFSLEPSTNNKKLAHLAALMMVNCAEESHDECQLIGREQEWMKYESMVIDRSSHLGIVGGELVTIAKVVVSLTYMKLCLGNLYLAIQLGYRGHQMCVMMRKFKLDYNVLSDLFSALFLTMRYKEAVHVLSWLEDLSFRDNDVIGKAYFVAACLALLLYAGTSWVLIIMCLMHESDSTASKCFKLGEVAIKVYQCDPGKEEIEGKVD
ncbi:UNVERIFIED_CONTAM: hypothetical protein K2H54_046402, partial [Gekko kuhli]